MASAKKYKKIDISQAASFFVSEDCAKALVDFRVGIKKPMNQRIFDNALKQAAECSLLGMTAEAALDRWMESGWTGMKWVLKEAQTDHDERMKQRTSLLDDLTDRTWANKPNQTTRERSLGQDLHDTTWADNGKT